MALVPHKDEALVPHKVQFSQDSEQLTFWKSGSSNAHKVGPSSLYVQSAMKAAGLAADNYGPARNLDELSRHAIFDVALPPLPAMATTDIKLSRTDSVDPAAKAIVAGLNGVGGDKGAGNNKGGRGA